MKILLPLLGLLLGGLLVVTAFGQEGTSLKEELKKSEEAGKPSQPSPAPEVSPQRKADLKAGRLSVESIYDAIALHDAEAQMPPQPPAGEPERYFVWKGTPGKVVKRGECLVYYALEQKSGLAVTKVKKSWGDLNTPQVVTVVGRWTKWLKIEVETGQSIEVPLFEDGYIEVRGFRL